MTLRLSVLAGVTFALTIAGCQADTASDDRPHSLESVASAEGAGGGLTEGWRAIPAVGWALDEWEDALDRFGDLVELLPQPAEFLCDHASDRDVLLRLRCEYWDRFKDHLDGDDEHDDRHEDDEDDEHDEHDGRDEDRGRGDRASGGAREDDESSDAWTSESDDDSDGPSGLGG